MSSDLEEPILAPGRNCWRIEHASRLALIIDAADYFRAVKSVILEARHAVYLIGWDFDTRINLEPEGSTLDGPNTLGAFLRWIDKTRPDVEVYVLKWDLGVLHALGRGAMPLTMLDWMTSSRIHLRLDGAHPPGAAHHQKIVVVDDTIAFCGGIDMTADRWDTREHADDDPRRKRPSGRAYGPWHDAATVVDGKVARALGDLARSRWLKATGVELDVPPSRPPIWPKDIDSTFEDVEVAIARTQPETTREPAVREIESFCLDAIASAQRAIYWESQYFASRRIAEALAERLRERNGPDIVIVNPLSADGFLEAMTMDTARARLLALIAEADWYKRFRIYTPVTQKRQPIYVHAKILIVDDRILRVGSSNINNRSMGFDTECDLVVEAAGSDARMRDLQARIISVRDDLLAEHLAVEPDRVRREVEREGSLVRAIDSLLGPERSLDPYKADKVGLLESPLAENDLLDPERPSSFMNRVKGSMQLRGSIMR